MGFKKMKTNFTFTDISLFAFVDVKQDFVMSTAMTPAPHHDSRYLPLCVVGSCNTKNLLK